MLRAEGFNPQEKTINIIFMNGGVGDHIASLVATDYIYKTYPWIRPLVWVPDFLLDFAKHVLPKYAKVNNYTSMQAKYNPNLTTKTTEWDGIISPMKIHCLDYAFLKLTDENPGIEHKNYLQINASQIKTSHFTLPKDYVVLTAGFTASVREFPAISINEISAYLHKNNIDIIYLGQKNTTTGAKHIIEGTFREEVDYAAGLNLIDKTSLLEAAAVMSNAKAVIGVDNGLLHVAGCTQVPIIGGFTTVSPELRMPVRNNQLGWNYYSVTPDDSLKCRFCQVKTNFLYNHKYTNCLYKDNLCTKMMTSDKFIQHLDSILAL